MLRTDFQRIELDPVRHHQRHRVTAADPDAVQAGGDPSNIGGVLAPGQCLGVAGGAKRDRVRVDLPRRAEKPRTSWSAAWRWFSNHSLSRG